MAYAKQRTRLEALELQNRRAMYACEQAAVKDIEARFAGLQRNLKAQLAATYIHCFGAEPSEFQKSKMTGFEYHWRAASGRVIAQFLQKAAPAFNAHLNTNWREEILRQAWALDQTTPRHVRIKIPALRRAREAAAVSIIKRADWVSRWREWMGYYADNVTRNVTMSTFDGADLETMTRKIESTKVGQPSTDIWAALERMARTEMLVQQQEARDEILDANSDLVSEEIWQTMEDVSVCDVCADNLGSTRTDASEDIPVHPNCILPDNLVECPDLVGAAKSFYNGRAVKITFSDGRSISVTENHPILTPRGFVAAKFLRKGGDVVRAFKTKGVAKAINPDYNAGPAPIQKVFEAFKMTRGVSSRRMPVAAEDFHGDARVFDGDVNIIGADSLLGRYQKSFFSQRINKELFASINAGHALNTKGAACKVCGALLPSPDGIMGGAGKGLPAFSTGLGHTKGHGIGSIANLNPHRFKANLQGLARHTERSRYFLQRFAAFITTAQIVKIEVFNYSGHVYDLQSDIFELYICNGIVVKNCRCFWRLVPKAFGDLMRSNPEAAAAMDEKGIVPDSLVIWDADQKEIKAMTLVDFDEWKNEEGRNITYGNGI